MIAPDADVKLWVDAAVEQRAERRWKELRANGEGVTLERVIGQLRERDARDQDRADAPAKMAADAVLIDTTDLTIEAAVEKALAASRGRPRRWKPHLKGLSASNPNRSHHFKTMRPRSRVVPAGRNGARLH
ncbi:MAG: (d)CMP kinase [Hyphomonas sp.]